METRAPPGQHTVWSRDAALGETHFLHKIFRERFTVFKSLPSKFCCLKLWYLNHYNYLCATTQPPASTKINLSHNLCLCAIVSSQTFSRRRPAGWTPLRKVEQPPPPSTRTTLTKEESSEEDTTATKPSASPGTSVVADVATDDPLRCPSKPWKPFNPPSVAAPTDAPKQPAADAPALSDKDLLA